MCMMCESKVHVSYTCICIRFCFFFGFLGEGFGEEQFHCKLTELPSTNKDIIIIIISIMRSSNNAANTKCFYRNKISRHFQPWSSMNNLASFDEVNNESAPFHHTQLSNISNIIWNSTGKLAIFFKQQHYTPSLNSHIALLDLWFFSYLAEPASELCILPSIINHKSPGWIQPLSLLYYLFTACFRKIFLHVRNKRQNLILTWTPKKD